MGPSKGSNPSYDGYNQFAFVLWTWARELRWWKGRLQMVSGWRVHKRVAGVQHNLLTEIFSSRTGWSCYNYISPCSYKILCNASQTRCGVRDRNQQVVGEKKWTENGRSEEVIVQWYVGWWNSGLLLEFTKRTMFKKKKKSHFLIYPQRQGGRDEDWHGSSLHAGARFCCHTQCEAVWTQTRSGICVLCLSLTAIQELKLKTL